MRFERVDFDENSELSVNSKHSPKSWQIQIRWPRAPLKAAILTEKAKMAEIGKALAISQMRW